MQSKESVMIANIKLWWKQLWCEHRTMFKRKDSAFRTCTRCGFKVELI